MTIAFAYTHPELFLDLPCESHIPGDLESDYCPFCGHRIPEYGKDGTATCFACHQRVKPGLTTSTVLENMIGPRPIRRFRSTK
jgi:hypothetical protein